MLGSPKYMSPEQVIGKRADHRSDIFSLGVIVYEMLTGAAPFSGENITALMYQIVNFAPPAPSSVNKAVPEMLDFILAKMLAKPVEERYADAREVARDLRECERSLAAPAAAAAAGRPAGLASGAEPELVTTHAKTVVMVEEVNRTRQQDKATEDAASAAAHGVSHSFDSAEATQRLASLTGAATVPMTATQAIGAIPRPPASRWRRRDWLLVGGAAVAGLVVAATILKKP
jgi:eukaryotic-like serine/threonine-protein kinase